MAGLLIAVAGIFSFMGGYSDWDFFMNSRKARIFVNVFGRRGARGFYMILGGLLTVVGVLFTAGILQDG